MIIFDQLRISDDGKRLYINAHVNNASYFDNIYIDSITIMTADKVSETSPNMPTEDYVYTETFDGDVKEVDLVLKAEDFIKTWEKDASAMIFQEKEMSNTLFFVYVKIRGVPDECTPCRLDEEVTVGVVFDTKILYQKIMNYTKDLLKDCNVPQAFVDFILLWNAFKAAIETEHFVPAIKYYNMLFDKVGSVSITKGCGCHG